MVHWDLGCSTASHTSARRKTTDDTTWPYGANKDNNGRRRRPALVTTTAATARRAVGRSHKETTPAHSNCTRTGHTAQHPHRPARQRHPLGRRELGPAAGGRGNEEKWESTGAGGWTDGQTSHTHSHNTRAVTCTATPPGDRWIILWILMTKREPRSGTFRYHETAD